tara:strand:- start:741 stop:1118 length:378 start_codon:yes stop_codon:yes gene_type:complete
MIIRQDNKQQNDSTDEDIDVSDVILNTKRDLIQQHRTLTEQLLQVKGAIKAVNAMEERLVTANADDDDDDDDDDEEQEEQEEEYDNDEEQEEEEEQEEYADDDDDDDEEYDDDSDKDEVSNIAAA